MDLQILKDSIPPISDQTAFRLKYVGARLSSRKLKGFKFEQQWESTCWSRKWVVPGWDKPIITKLHINPNYELYDLLCFEIVGKKNEERVLTDYSIIKPELTAVLDDLVVKPPPKDIYEEWYSLSEFYSLQDIFHKNWAEEWCPGSTYFTNNDILLLPYWKDFNNHHQLPPSDVLHKMCYIINHSVNAGIWNDHKVFTDDFSSILFEHPLLIRLLVSVIRHLEEYPCRDCFFELYFPLAVQCDIPKNLMPPLMAHALTYDNFTPSDLQSMSFAYDKFDKLAAGIECTREILRIEPDNSSALTNLQAYEDELKVKGR